MNQREKAERLRALHRAGDPLVLVNAWDAASALIVQSLGFPVIATTSAAIANAEGYSDGERISRDSMLERVRLIVQSVAVPVTADMEAGYGPSAQDARATAAGTIEAGAVGLNYEDSQAERGPLIDIELQQDRIRALRSEAQVKGVPLVINARTDVYLAGVGEPETRLDHAIRRGNAYLEAGADCIFVPGVIDASTIEALVKGIRGLVSVLAGPGCLSVRQLGSLGIARVSIGSAGAAYALAKFRDAALEVRDRGSFEFTRERIPYAELNALFR